MEKGMKTPEYEAIQFNSTSLGSNLEPVLRKVTAKCFEINLIGKDRRDKANDQRELESVRSGDLVNTILDKIESHSRWYEVFMKILEEFTELNDIVRAITTSLAAYRSSSTSGKQNNNCIASYYYVTSSIAKLT